MYYSYTNSVPVSQLTAEFTLVQSESCESQKEFPLKFVTLVIQSESNPPHDAHIIMKLTKRKPPPPPSALFLYLHI